MSLEPQRTAPPERPTVTTTVQRATTGTRVGPSGGPATCSRCERSIGEGDIVGAHAYAMSDETCLSIARVVCRECRDETIVHGTLGADEYLVTGVLATRSNAATQAHDLVFVADEIAACSPPEDGGEP